jgi:hypothetical protein
MTPQQTLDQIEKFTLKLVELSLSSEQNFPATHGKPSREYEITTKNAKAMTVALKNVAYRDIYVELLRSECYNIKMLDGALISIRYRFDAGMVSEHTLAYFPSPDLEQFQNEPEIYLQDEIYADIVAKNIVAFPIRFDYNSDSSRFKEVDHPMSHLTLGQFVNCRIPVCSPVGPLTFGGFILRNFYNTAFRKYSEEIPTSKLRFEKTIGAREVKIPHIVCG